MRQRVADEIIPKSVRHSRTKDGDEESNGAALAIDLDLLTVAFSAPDEDGDTWLEVRLDGLHCIKKVLWYYYGGRIGNTRTCTYSGCSCSGGECNSFRLIVSSEETSTDGLPHSECKYGYTVTMLSIDPVKYTSFELRDLAITGKQSGENEMITLRRKKKY